MRTCREKSSHVNWNLVSPACIPHSPACWHNTFKVWRSRPNLLSTASRTWWLKWMVLEHIMNSPSSVWGILSHSLPLRTRFRTTVINSHCLASLRSMSSFAFIFPMDRPMAAQEKFTPADSQKAEFVFRWFGIYTRQNLGYVYTHVYIFIFIYI